MDYRRCRCRYLKDDHVRDGVMTMSDFQVVRRPPAKKYLGPHLSTSYHYGIAYYTWHILGILFSRSKVAIG